MNFTEQPTGLTGCLSPLIYQVYDANYASTDFYYELEIYVWTGAAVLPGSPVAVVQLKPDTFAGGRAKIDIRKIVQQYVERDISFSGTYQPNINTGSRYVAVEATGYWTGGGPTLTVASNIQRVTAGYSYTFEGLNADFSAKEVYTDRTILYLTTDTPEFYIWFDANTLTTIDVGAYSQAINAIVNNAEMIQGIDIVTLMSNAGLTGTDSTISFTGGSTTLEVKYLCASQYGEQVVHFRNRYGVYETFVFNSLSKNEEVVTKEKYNQPIYQGSDLTSAYSLGVGIETGYLSNMMRTKVVNTEYLKSEENEIIRQMFLSRSILLYEDSTIKAVRVADSSFNEKTILNDKLIQYTIRLSYAQPLVNTMIR